MKKILIAKLDECNPIVSTVYGKRNIPLYRNVDGITEYVTTVEVIPGTDGVYMVVPDAVMKYFSNDVSDEFEWDFSLRTERNLKLSTQRTLILGDCLSKF